ncbi:OLC1v1028436C1 [Oldenlandia corymbosa var. corymbosa]|uniref:OLC1v1028436C1 n=1 Tax=Oldenlandia corymbosa var. corymbosa TaxID=529605 RepID=A0AAV1CC80_OLDCO|nr:OLC1v1028436C1 [Oldenlandia corymbosa var. corymbosa]
MRKVRARYLTMSRRKKKEEKEKKKRMKMTQVNMGGVPFQTRSSQPIYVPEYSQDDVEEEDEDEEDEENEFDEDDVQDSVRMGAHHRDTPMYNLSSYPPPRYSSCPRPGPGGLPSPPTPLLSPMSGGSSQSRVSDEIDPTIWLVTDEVPGGPIDGSVIPSFLGHIAYHFWHGYNKPTLKIFKGEKILNKLKMWYKDIDDVVRGKIRGTGLGACEDGYLEWYRQYSHPFLLPTTDPSAVSTPARSSQDYWMNELRKLMTDQIRKVKESDRDLADEYDEKLQDTMIRYYKAP